jgi:predicted alpha/beta-fold hydrolase
MKMKKQKDKIRQTERAKRRYYKSMVLEKRTTREMKERERIKLHQTAMKEFNKKLRHQVKQEKQKEKLWKL